MPETIVFIGGGNMATSLISGLCGAGGAAGDIHVVEPDDTRRAELAQHYGVHPPPPADSDVLGADVCVLAVKPQIMQDVARGLAPLIGTSKPLVISIAAGISLTALKQWLGENLPYVRCMPNTPSLIGAGATGLYADEGVTSDQCALAEAMLATAGTTVWVESESLLDAVIATSGSGPAYFFAFMEAMQAGAESLGLDAATARELVLQTALGAARKALESGDDPATLRRNVTSPGGTTEQALETFAEGDLQALVARAMQAAAARADTLAEELRTG